MTTFVTFPTVAIFLQDEWILSNTETGILFGVFFIGFIFTTFILTSLTDFIDSRYIYIFGIILIFIAGISFGYFANNFYTAFFWRLLHGIGLGATYMPGLKLLTDILPFERQSRATAFYTSSFSIGTALSFYLSGIFNDNYNWQFAFYLNSLGPIFSLFLFILFTKKPLGEKSTKLNINHLINVLKNKKIIGYALTYFIHNIELFTFRSWIIIFLFFSLSIQKTTNFSNYIQPATIAAIISLIAMPSSVIFNELTRFYKREKLLNFIFFFAALLPISIGLFANANFMLIIILVFIYGIIIPADSSVITAGLISSSQIDFKGTAMGIHSFIGFTGAILGPIIFGVLLDLGGGKDSYFSWLISFFSLGVIMLFGPLIIKKFIKNS